jgi:HEAT repeat protein
MGGCDLDPVPLRRRKAALAGHSGDVTTLRDFLEVDEDPLVRATALAGLERAGELDDERLRRALLDPAATVRRRAAQLAARHPKVSLRGRLDDADASVAEMAAWAAGEQPDGTTATVTALVAMAREHEDPLCREAAVAALGALGAQGVTGGLPAILHATGDRPAIRRRAVLALAPFDGPEVEAALRRALEDRDWQVRQAAEDLLG